MPPAIEVKDLQKVYRLRSSRLRFESSMLAVDNVSFAVGRGESLAIVGESGSGKTTIARMIVGLETPTAGMIWVAGRERSKHPRGSANRQQRGRETQIVFQNPYSSLDPRQRVRDGLDEILGLHFRLSHSERDARVGLLMERVGLDRSLGHLRPNALSGGERQRVAIARALAAEPQVLILDEAVSSLDMSIQAQILNLLAEIREGGDISYIFISHNLAVVRQITDYAIVMQRGRVVERGLTSDIIDHPVNEYTQLLRNSVPGPGWRPSRLMRVES